MSASKSHGKDDFVWQAYRMLKQDCYYDTTDLFLRGRLSEFEKSGSFDHEINNVKVVVQELAAGKPADALPKIQKWLKEISFHCLPKSVAFSQDASDKFISNVRVQESYPIEHVNYFINAPMQLHLLDFLWCMTVGPIFDRKLDELCLGNRLEYVDDEMRETSSGHLFKIFHRQYSKWRDDAIRCASALLDQKLDVLLVSLDIKQCYYHLPACFDDLRKTISQKLTAKERVLALGITDVLAAMHDQYSVVAGPMLAKSHSSKTSMICGLPVGLASSRILANVELNKWDKAIRKKIRPAYYGRYVDDMLFVLASPPEEAIEGKIDTVMEHFFIKTGLLEPKATKDSYGLTMLPTLDIAKEKLIVNYFDHNHSRAGLTKFQEEISKQASEFRFLPSEEGTQTLDECAYDVLYKGSINKLRSVIGLAENSTELSKYLARRLMQYRLSLDTIPEEVVQQLMRFYRGRNMFVFCRLWEKVFTLLLVNKKENDSADIFKGAQKTIDALTHDHVALCEKVKRDTLRYLCLSLAMPVGLHSHDYEEKVKGKRLRSILGAFEIITDASSYFRNANMIRHQFVRYPLINYTSYPGSLIDCDFVDLAGMDRLEVKEDRSPRFVHPDEKALFEYFSKAANGTFETLLKENIHDLWREFRISDVPSGDDLAGTKTFRLKIGEDLKKKDGAICIGIANLKVKKEDIERSYNSRKSPNTSFERQAVLYDLINAGVRGTKCDLLVFPEVSIPYSWVPFMVAQARRSQMGMVFGVEHLVGNGTAYNLLATVLPFQTKNGHFSCYLSLRLKNHYAPDEELALGRLGLKVPKRKTAIYECYLWRGMEFATYNCFELTNIRHRGLFRSEVDFLVVASWNQDIPYYNNIIESVARDIHCYIIQANASQFGDSRVTGPLRSYEMNRIRISGGENHVLLKAKFDIADLRDFQSKSHCPSDERFKPLPAGFDQQKARKRGLV
jgi:hypothetical protein